jgi:hypothetical protein
MSSRMSNLLTFYICSDTIQFAGFDKQKCWIVKENKKLKVCVEETK